MGVVALRDIQDFVADMAREFLPEKVILFGSYATGSAGAESDIDLLVVMSEDVSGVRVAADIITRLKPVLPVELVVRSSRQIREAAGSERFFPAGNYDQGKRAVCSPSPLSGSIRRKVI